MSRSPVRLPTAVLVGFGILCLHGCIGRPGGADHRDAEGSAGLGRLYEEEGFAYRDGSKLTNAEDFADAAAEAGKPPAATAPKAFPRQRPIGGMQAIEHPEKAPDAPDAAKDDAPISLTASDGSGLELRSLDARTVVDGPLAFTELHLVFHNPEARQREGRFAITLPPKAAISRFAMKISGSWMEGEVVEKQRARQVYEDFLHRRQDPAILEQDAGNTFRARVFPIPPSGDKEIVVSFSQERADPKEPLRLALRGLGKLGELGLHGFVRDGERDKDAPRVHAAHIVRKDFTPTVDWLLYPDRVDESTEALRNANLTVTRVQVRGKEREQGFGKVVVLVDTSASQAPAWEARLQQLAAVVRYVGSHGGSEVAVVAFDQTREAIYRGAPGGFGDKHLAALRARAPLGGTDLGAALDHAGTVAASFGATSRVVLLSNGVATLGELDAGRLGARAAKLAEQGVVRLDTVCSTTARDVEALHAVATGGLPHAGVQLQLASGEQEPDLAALGRSTLAPIDVAVAGAGWVWPTRLEGLQDGDHALVYAEIPEAEPLRLTLSGGMVASLEPKTRSTIEPLLRRAWVRARIELLLSGAGATSDEQRATLRAEALRLSVKHRVLCELTALLVLETEFDYTRYHIDRKALADILTITHGGAAVLRSREQLAELLEDGRVANEVVEKVGARGNAEPGAPLAAPPAPAPTGGTVEKVTTGRPSRDDTREVNPEEQKKSVESIERKAIAGERVRGSAASRLFAAPDDDKDSIVEAKRYGEGEHELALRASAKASRLAAAPMASKKKLEHKLRLRLTLRPLTFRDAIDQSIDKVVTRKTPALRRCAENHVRAHGGGNLRAEFRITVGTAGTVTEVSTTNMPADLEECVAIKLRRIRGLPLLPSPRPATYEFLLSNDDAETAEETDGVTILPLGAKDADSDAIDGYAAGHAYGARWCYRALPAQERFRELEGRLQLTVDVDRKVTKATVTGLPQQLEQCVRKSLLHVDGFERASLVVAKAATREYRLVFNDPTAKRERPSPAQIAAWQRRHDEVTADRLARRIFAARVGVPDTHGHVAAFEQKLLQAANFDWDGVQTGCVAQALERKSGPLSLELRLVVDANENIRGWQLTSDDESLRTCAHAALAEPAFSVGADNERRKLDQDREKAALPPTVRSLRWTWARGKSPEAPTEPQPLAAEAIAGLVANFDVVREQHRLERERRSAVERREAELGLLRGAAVALTPAERKAARAEKEATLVGREGLQGQLRAVHDAIAAGRTADAVDLAWKSRHASATDVLALVALGDALLAQGDKVRAARAYASIIELYPSRADLRRYAGNLVERASGAGDAVAVDIYGVAVEQRPDHPAGHQMRTMALAAARRYIEALDAALAGLRHERRSGNFRMVERILEDDMAIVARAAIAADPGLEKEVLARLDARGLQPDTAPSLRFVLTWETDTNDVDFHIFDAADHHASYSGRFLPNGALFADITTGYGPECFRIDRPEAYPYALMAHYYSMGPMGYGMGRMQILRHDGAGGLGFESRPYVIMKDGAWFDMGLVTAESAPVGRAAAASK